MEDTKQMTVCLNQKNAMFVGRKKTLWKFADQNVLETIDKPT